MLNTIEYLINEKKLKTLTNEELEKLELIEKICNNDEAFFKMDYVMAKDILSFLGVPDEQILDYYFSLISPSNYKKTAPKIYNIVDEEKIQL